MTAIVGIFDGERTWLASDGRCMAGDVIISDSATKILTRGPWLLGVSGDRRTHLALSGIELREHHSAEEVSALIREAVVRQGWHLKSDDEPSWSYNVLLGGTRGLFHHCSVGTAVAVPTDRPFGTGSGGCYAEAAAWEALRHGLRPEQAIISGIQAAMAYVPTCGGEITVACSEPARLTAAQRGEGAAPAWAR